MGHQVSIGKHFCRHKNVFFFPTICRREHFYVIWASFEKHGHFIDKEKYLVNVFIPVHIYFSSRFHASFQWAYSLLNISELISFPFDSSRLQLSKVFSLENHTFHCRNFWQVSATCWLVELTKNTRPETHHDYKLWKVSKSSRRRRFN